MSCCVIALAMVYRLIDAWQRGRGWAAGAPAVARAALKGWRVRAALVLALTVEAAVAGGLTYQHRHHLGDLGARVLFATIGIGADLCRTPGPAGED